MSDPGKKGAARASAILLGAALLRTLSLPADSAPVPLRDRPTVADSLSASADSLAAENDRRRRPLDSDETLDVNTASEIELDRLPGVGATLAARIVASRQTEGPFSSLEELTRVSGLGAKSLQRIGPHLESAQGTLTPLDKGTKEELARRRLLGVMERPASASSFSASVTKTGARQAAVRLNRATHEQLKSLPGIGPVLATRIVEYRDARGGFEKAEELLGVPGLGPKTFAQLRGLIVVR